MSATSSIEWTDATWNPVTGCDRVSPGCDNCYAATMAKRFHRPFFGAVECHPDRLELPLRWRKPRRVFVNSVSDLFHPDVPDLFIAEVFAVMGAAAEHTFQVLTKRPQRMMKLLNDPRFCEHIEDMMGLHTHAIIEPPLPNVWLGVSVENQRYADLRIPHLLATPAAVRFISAEPLLGRVDLVQPWVDYLRGVLCESGHAPHCGSDNCEASCPVPVQVQTQQLDWVIVGGESGHGARPMHPQWARSLRDQCTSAGVPFFFKQWGEYLGVPIVDDPHMSGGRGFDVPGGGHHAAVLRQRAPEKNHFRGGSYRAMEPGDRTGHGTMLDLDTMALKVGKGKAGRELDGRTWDEYPG